MKRVRSIALILSCAAVAHAAGGEPLPAARDERFGVMTHFAQGWDAALVPLVARTGVGGVRDELYWREVEPEKGRFVVPAGYAKYMDALRRTGLSPLIVLSFENPRYDGGATPYTDEGIAGFARYTVEVLRRFGSQIKAVEIWNEYNGTFVHGPATADRSGHYLRLLQTVYPAIKRERPDVTVVGGATSGVPLPYWEKLVAGGGLACMDAVSVHPYRYSSTPEGIETDIAELRALLDRHEAGEAKPIWITEVGWGVKPAEAPGDLAIDDETQAKFLARGFALLLSAGAERIYWYLFRDHQGMAMGLVRGDARSTRRPAYDALTTLTEQLRGARFVRREATPPELYSILFMRPDREEVRVLWSVKPRRLELTGARQVVDLSGVPVPVGGGFDVGDSPVFVSGAVRGLPEACAADVALADSRRDFSPEQGRGGWYYGTLAGPDGTFVPLPRFGADDWHACWTGPLPFGAITAEDQHPSVEDGKPVSIVRRWRSDYDGAVRIAGRFRKGVAGDGVDVRIAIDGQPVHERRLGNGQPIADEFDFVEDVHAGTTVDFAVAPGPAANIDGDATTLAVTIRKETP